MPPLRSIMLTFLIEIISFLIEKNHQYPIKANITEKNTQIKIKINQKYSTLVWGFVKLKTRDKVKKTTPATKIKIL